MPLTGGGGLTRVPNLRVCKHLVVSGVPHAGEKDELTSCRGTFWSAWQKTTSETQRRKSRAARKGEWPPHGTGTTVLTYPGSAPGGQARVVKTVNIQDRWAAAPRNRAEAGEKSEDHKRFYLQ